MTMIAIWFDRDPSDIVIMNPPFTRDSLAA